MEKTRIFWSPIAISSGLVVFFLGVNLTQVSLLIGWIGIIAGIVLLAFGFLWARKKYKAQRFWSPIGIGAGLTILVAGALLIKDYIIASGKDFSGIELSTGIVDVLSGIVLLILGFYAARGVKE